MSEKELVLLNKIMQDEKRIKRQLHQLIGFWSITGNIYIENIFNKKEKVILSDEANYKINKIIKADLEKQLKEKEGMLYG